ncbi:MAG TPA: hypothetical protein VFY18_02775 [Candidatus Limnocylindrales bacterium]|nr:hypothetical protein [Candidatus Limnocylindrales bacterium]
MNRALRALGALAIIAGLLLPAAMPVAAAEPHRPLPGYRPQFVTERASGRWEDCLWASAAMLVDKWTAGQARASKERLRSLSGDAKGGSTFGHLDRALARIGLHARTSPHGGDFVTWNELRKRLAAGGGAILLGDYSRLPRYYGRWDPRFWRGEGKNDNHAIYLDGYDRRTDRFFVMDPLAPAGWRGEWIPARYIHAYAWKTSGGGLFTVMTPAAVRAPFAGVSLEAAIAFAGIDGVHIAWPVAKAPKGWVLPGLDLKTTVAALTDGRLPPGDDVVAAPPVLVPANKAAAPKPPLRFVDEFLQATLPTPTAAGTYAIVATLRERRFHRAVATTSLTLYVPGERRGTIAVSGPAARVSGLFRFVADVTNSGSVSWADPARVTSEPPEADSGRNTMLVGTWVPVDADGAALVDLEPVTLGRLPLDAGQGMTISGSIPTPATPGRWALVLDIVDDEDGSFAAHGSQPGTILVDLSTASDALR